MPNRFEWTPRLTELNRKLADLYPTGDDSRRIATQAGLRSQDIAFNQSAQLNWFNILDKARRTDQVGDIVEAALQEYPADPVLLKWGKPSVFELQPSKQPARGGRLPSDLGSLARLVNTSLILILVCGTTLFITYRVSLEKAPWYAPLIMVLPVAVIILTNARRGAND